MGKRVIRLTEADIEKIVKKVIKEQTEEVLVNKLNDKIKSVMVKNQNEIFNGVKLVASKPDNNFIINISNISLKLYLDETNKPYQGYLPNWVLNEKGYINTTSIPLSNFYDDIWEKDDDLKTYYEENPYIKNQMDKLLIPLTIKFKTTRGLKIIQFAPNLKLNIRTKKYLKNHSNGNIGGLGDFYDNNLAYFQLDNVNYEITSINWEVELGEVNILPPQVDPSEPEKPEIATEEIELDLVDVFKYDSIDVKEPSGYQEILNKFKEDLKQGFKRMSGFKEFLETQNLVVKGYASQDADPDADDGGNLPACSKYGKGKGPRSEYNKCLSQERAQKVANDLQEIFDELVGEDNKIQVNAEGNGETYIFGGDGWDNGKDSEEDLSKNRRVTFNIPKYTENIRN